VIVAEVLLLLVGVYLLCGLVVGVPFVLRGVDVVDEAAKSAPLGFRLLILPGSVALWPLVRARWIKSRRTGGRP
jgi:hypothetical protein